MLLLGLCAWPVVALGHQLLLLAVAGILHATVGSSAADALVAGGGDVVYSRLALGMLAGAEPLGFAVAGPLGGALHAVLPRLFADPEALGAAGLTGPVFVAGSSSVGVQAAQLIVNLGVAAIGVALLLVSFLRLRRRWLRRLLFSWRARALGIVCLGCGAGAELGLYWGSGSGGEMAMSMVATKVLGLPSEAYAAAIKSGWLLSFAINFCALLGGCLAAAAITLAAVRVVFGRNGLVRINRQLRENGPNAAVAAFVVGPLLVLGAARPSVGFGEGGGQPELAAASANEAGADAVDDAAAEVDPIAVPATRGLPPGGTIQPGAANVVTIMARGDSFEYRVNGRRQFIRGIGYNAITKNLPQDQRAARFERDFAEIHDFGANTLVGWDQDEFDGLLLDKAAQHGLGVIDPITLNSTWAYDDRSIRQQLMHDIAVRVEHDKDSPALRIWGLGNEVVHDISKARSPRAPAFVKFLVDAADLIHAIDPAHPVVYRDAEDVYLPPVAAALRADGLPRPWFIYGMNFFTTRIDDALNRGPTRTLRQPLLISEFGPVGLRPADRPAGYARFWNTIVAHNSTLLGGAAYVWSTIGPEPLDRGFGLTNEAGEPVDGSIQALSKLFISQRDDDIPAPNLALTSSR
jgi:hypothetical protein